MRKLRILILNWRDVQNPESGGAEIFVHEVARRWVSSGHVVNLLTSGFDGARALEVVDGIEVRRIGRLRRGTFHARVQRELASLQGYDLLIDAINTMPFLTPLWRRRLPPTLALIHQLAQDVWDAELPRPFAAVGRFAERRFLRLYSGTPVVTLSKSTHADLLRLGFQRVWVVPPGRDEPPRLNGVRKEPVPTLLFVGRLAANKRPAHAVDAFRLLKAELPEARLWVVGRGTLEQRLAEQLPAGAKLLGYLPRAELYERMARAHCLLVPSVREGWGLVVIEAGSVGTPAVGYDVPGIRDSIRHGETGELVPPGNVEELAAVAASLLRDEHRYDRVSHNARVWASQFSWDATADGLLRLVDNYVLGGAAANPSSGPCRLD